jgi:adenine phosphoribosyltransferase
VSSGLAPSAAGSGLPGLISAKIRDIPDYPQPGVVFKDITPLLADGDAFAAVVSAMAEDSAGIDKVVGIEARGFILAAPVAYRMRAGFVPVRKQGKLPAETLGESYELEYGTATVEVHVDAFRPGERVLIVDDVLATGGTAAASRWRRSRSCWNSGSSAAAPGCPAWRSARCWRCDQRHGPQGGGHVMDRPPIDWLLRRT